MPSDLINTFASAVRLLLALRMSAGMPKGSKQSARNSINTYSAEMSALSELQATLTLMIYGMSHGTSEPSIDVSDCLSAASLHEQLHQIRSLTHAPGEADAISAVFMDSVRSKLELNSYIKSVHGLCIANPVPCADVVEPFLPCPESDRLRIVSSMAAVLRREREGVHSRQHLLNDDCFALLRCVITRIAHCSHL